MSVLFGFLIDYTGMYYASLAHEVILTAICFVGGSKGVCRDERCANSGAGMCVASGHVPFSSNCAGQLYCTRMRRVAKVEAAKAGDP